MDNLKAYFSHPLLTFGAALLSHHSDAGIVIHEASVIAPHELGHMLLSPDPLLPHWGLSDPQDNMPFAVAQGGELLDLEIRVVAAQLAICTRFGLPVIRRGLASIIGAGGLAKADELSKSVDIDALWAETQLKLKRA